MTKELIPTRYPEGTRKRLTRKAQEEGLKREKRVTVNDIVVEAVEDKLKKE